MKKYFFRKLTTRLVVTFGLLAIPGALLVGYSSYSLARKTLEASIYDKLETIASIKEENLRWWIAGLKTDIKRIADTDSLQRSFRVFTLGSRESREVAEAYETMARELNWWLESEKDFTEIFLLTRSEGRVFLSTDKTREGSYGVDDGYFIKGLRQTFVQTIYTSPGETVPHTIISTPFLSPYGEELGVLAARVGLERVDEIFLGNPGLGASGEAYLVDRLNNFVSAKRFGRENYPKGVHSPGIDSGIKGVDGRGLYGNYEGKPVIGVYHWIEELGLVLVTEIGQSEAFGPARRLGWSLFLLGMGIAGIILLGSFLMSVKVVRPILMIRDAAARVARGDLWAKAPVVTADEVGMLAASFNEMTERLQLLYNALQASEEHFSTVFRLSPDAITVIRMADETFVDVNEGFTNITGFTREEIIGRSTPAVGMWIDDPSREAFIRELEADRHLDKQEVKFNRKDGSVFISSISARIVDIAGEPHRISVIRDVTSLRDAQNELRRTNAVLRTQMELSMSGILVLNEDGEVVSHNRRYLEMWDIPPEALEPGREGPVMQSVLEKVSDPDRFGKRMGELMEHRSVRYQGEVALKDGRIFEEYTAPMIDGKEDYYGRVIFFRDITESRRSEEHLRSSVREKEVLLQEVHHRVKNNLQVISGLLDLQSYHITDDRSKEIYKESQNRVLTMALIHEELYQAKDLAQVDYGAYIRSLVTNLFTSYAVDPGRIKLTIQAEEVQMVVDTAIPCGLIINELVTNSIKHAFPGGKKGEVSILFGQRDEGRYHLEISDDGVGMATNPDAKETSSLGLQLVRLLVDQLSGEMRIEGGSGTRFVIDFKEYLEAGARLF